jgi:hypothetical protein
MIIDMVKKTRKITKTKKAMTIPQLRRAFEHINAFVAKKGIDVDSFSKEWKKTFGKDVSPTAAKEYLAFVAKRGKMTGGSAPLSYEMRQGVPEGSYPQYVQDGFGFANHLSSEGQQGNVQVPPPASLGQNTVGGGKKRKTIKKQKGGSDLSPTNWDKIASVGAVMMNRPFTPTSLTAPSSMGIDAQMRGLGVNTMPSSRPEIPSFDFTPTIPTYGAYVSSDSKII